MANDNMEKNRKKRKTSKSDEVGSKKPSVEEVASFVSFRLDGRLLKAVSNQFGKPTLVQAAAIPLALNGRDIVARAKTGSGKTLAYVIPIIHQILAKLVCQNFWTRLISGRKCFEARAGCPCARPYERVGRTGHSSFQFYDNVLREAC